MVRVSWLGVVGVEVAFLIFGKEWFGLSVVGHFSGMCLGKMNAADRM